MSADPNAPGDQTIKDQPIDDLAARLERERLDADRRYNSALTELDRAITSSPTHFPPPPSDAGPHGDAIRTLIDIVRQQADAQELFQNRLMLFLQTITGFVETKDRSIGGSELRDEIVRARARTLEIQRAVEQLTGGHGTTAPAVASSVTPHSAAASGNVTGATYLGFEDQFRGTRDAIRTRQADYLSLFAGCANVLDVGCGRGELLDLFREQGITAHGVDINPAMVAACRERGLTADAGDALSYLSALPDGSLGGLIALQVVEHLEPPILVRFLETAFLKLRPGAPIVLETINAACWMAFFETYIRDLTHARPLHPDTLKFLVTASGFRHADVRFRAPVEDQDRLPRVSVTGDAAQTALADAINAHADRLNGRLFSSMDYAVIARR